MCLLPQQKDLLSSVLIVNLAYNVEEGVHPASNLAYPLSLIYESGKCDCASCLARSFIG